MKWLAAWITFSCVVVPVWALLCARLREAKRWTVYTGNRSVETMPRWPARESGFELIFAAVPLRAGVVCESREKAYLCKPGGVISHYRQLVLSD